MRIALLSNVTVEVLAGMLGKEHAVWTPSGFGAWMETALEPPAELVAFAPEMICLLIDRRYGAFDDAVQDVGLACRRLRERFPAAAVIAPDLERLAVDGGAGFYDEKMWKLGKMPFSISALRELKKLFVRRKAVAVDLDNTLWKGIVGEDGVEGIVPDAAFQRQLKELKECGIVLVALSKNNPEDVEPVWSDPRMVLEKSDFVALEVNWNDKAENLVRVAKELNLGTDAFVFVDDRPVERARMRAACPDALVADFPPQLDVFFPFAATTAEDARRTAMYQAESRRREFAANLSVEDYRKVSKVVPDFQSSGPRPALSERCMSIVGTSQPCSGATCGRNTALRPRFLRITPSRPMTMASDPFTGVGSVSTETSKSNLPSSLAVTGRKRGSCRPATA